jgi:hypothetical protein
MARKQTKKTTRKAPKGPQASVAGNVAEYIGTSLADLMNRKDTLVRQLGDVDRQIASVRDVGAKLASAVPRFVGLTRPTGAGKKRAAKKTRTGNRKRKRPLPPNNPMVEATTRTRLAEAKGRAAKRDRTTQRSGNR